MRHVRLWLAWAALLPLPALAVEHVEIRRDGQTIHVAGKVEVQAQDGGLLLRGEDGRLWILQPEEIASRREAPGPFRALDAEQLSSRLLEEMGDGFAVHRTAHYVVCYNTSPEYARWCGALYERLYRAFQAYWKSSGCELHEPEAPLMALVFDSRQSFAAYARRDLGADPGALPGYYSLRTNRVNMYDLTGVDGRARGRGPSAARINQILMQPRAERTVATIVHEAAHQLAYNCGLQTRYADNPFWVSEGLAVYFETPDLRSSRGWRGIGEVNRVNLLQFRTYLRSRPDDSLETILAADTRFRDPKTQGDAYAEAWALNYYLLRRHREKYVGYLKQLAARQPLVELTGAERRAEFVATFGPLDALDRDFLRYMQQVR